MEGLYVSTYTLKELDPITEQVLYFVFVWVNGIRFIVLAVLLDNMLNVRKTCKHLRALSNMFPSSELRPITQKINPIGLHT